MRDLCIFNSFSGKREKFEPIDSKNIRVYCCGPTVYSRPHLGNMRSVVVADMLVRVLNFLYKEKVTYVRNITDIDDKIIDASNNLNVPIDTITEDAISGFHEDCEFLNCLKPTLEPRATESIPEIISMIQTLIKRGYAYEASGHVFFSVEKFKEYGSLSKKTLHTLEEGARVEVLRIKKNPFDFVLWKPEHNLHNKSTKAWNSPFGHGRPGWHIECSAMIMANLGKDLDIHCGGVDLKFPHHENEIAQSKCANASSSFAKYWFHNGILMVENVKMSKSTGNIIKVSDLKKDASNIGIRYFLLSFHYTKPANFTTKGLRIAESFCQRILKVFRDFGLHNLVTDYKLIPAEFIDSLMDDFNTTRYLSCFHGIVNKIQNSTYQTPSQEYQTDVQSIFNAGLLLGLWDLPILEQNINNTSIHNEQQMLVIKKELLTLAIGTVDRIKKSQTINFEQGFLILVLDSMLRMLFNKPINSTSDDHSQIQRLLSFVTSQKTKESDPDSIGKAFLSSQETIELEKTLRRNSDLSYYDPAMVSLLLSQIEDKLESKNIITYKPTDEAWDNFFVVFITILYSRLIAKTEKDFSKADKIRVEIERKYSVNLIDTPEGLVLSKKPTTETQM